MNFAANDKEFLKKFVITSDNDFQISAKYWIATMVLLINNYLNIVVPINYNNVSI